MKKSALSLPKGFHSSFALVAGLLALGGLSAFGAAETWTTGVGTANWSTGSNWMGTNTPPVSGDSLNFGTTGGPTTLNNDLTTSSFSITGISFAAGAAAYTINGNDFTLAGTIANSSGTTQTINNNMILSGNRSINAGAVVLGGALTGSGTLTISGGGVAVSLNGTNSYSGGTTVGSSALAKIGNASSFGTGNVTVASTSGQFDNISGADLTISNTLAFTGGTITYVGTANNLTFSNVAATLASNLTLSATGNTMTLVGVIGETGGARNLSKTGPGTIALNGVNTYSGTTTISSGTLSVNTLANIGTASSIGKGDATSLATNQASLIINGGALKYTGTTASTDRLFTLGTGTSTIDASGSGAITFSNTNAILSSTTTGRALILGGSNTGDNTLASAWTNAQGSGINTLFKNGTGKWILSGSNSYTGVTTVNSGILQFAKQVSLYSGSSANWTAAKITVNSGGTLALNVGGSGEFTSSDVDTIKAIGTGTTGLKSGAVLGLDTTNASGGAFTYASNIANTNGGTNAIGLTKLGSNTLNLTGSNSYSGATTVTAGTLLVNGNNSGGGATSVTAGTLGGAGTIAGTVAVGDGAGGHDSTLAPGNAAVGTLSTGALSLNSDATFAFELNSTAVTADQVSVTGAVNIVSGAQFSFTDLGSGVLTLGTVFTLISNDGSDTITGTFANLANGSIFTSNGNTYQASYSGGSGNDLTLTVVVPEPSTVALVGVGLVVVTRMIRRRKSI